MQGFRNPLASVLICVSLVWSVALWQPTAADPDPPTVVDVASAMQTCLTVDKGSSPWSATVEIFGGDVYGQVVSVKLFGQYGSADGSLLPDDPTLIGNAEGHSHPTLPIALVFARTSYAATMREPIEAARGAFAQGVMVGCFNSTFRT
jgi:hypothetical protein